MRTKKNNYSVIEIFSGAGGMALGFENAGLSAKVLVEMDGDCVKTLKNNRNEWNVIGKDISEVNFKGMKADMVAGGFPCQPFSFAGQRRGFKDKRGKVFFEFLRCVKEVNPKMFIAENVAGLLSHDKGKTIKTILSMFSELGYNVRYKLINSMDYGIPQKRRRIFIVGTKPGVNFKYPKQSRKISTIKDVIKKVPKTEGYGYSKEKKEIMEKIPPGGCWINLPVNLQKKYMGKSFYLGGGKRGMARRLSWDEPSLTLTTSPNQKHTERCHPEETRPLTVGEYSRIQTFPDKWKFSGSISSRYRQIGNAVPVKLAEKMGKCVIQALSGA